MNYPTQPPRRRLDRGKIIAFSFLGVLALIIAVSVATSSGSDSDNTAAADTSSAAPAKPAKEDKAEPQGDEKKAPKEEPKPKPASEADDVTSIRLDDRSEYGIVDIWVVVDVTNSSSKNSDYEIRYEVTGSDGTRLYNSEFYITDVQPGQAATQDDFTTLEVTEGLKLTVTKVDRTEAW